MTIAPVVVTVDTRASLDHAFELFTSRMGDWWGGKTIGAKPHVAIVIEPHSGGRWYERAADGTETMWGTVRAFEPPRRLLLGWQLDSHFAYDPDILTEVEISFTACDGGGTCVRLEHRNLERFGDDATRVAGQVGDGWPRVLAGLARLAEDEGRAPLEEGHDHA